MTPGAGPANARAEPTERALTLFDLYVLAVLVLSVLFGAARGLAREAITLLALLGGVASVALLARPLGGAFGDELPAVIAAVAGLFALGFVLVHAALELIARRLIGAAPHRADRALGGLFGALRGWFLVSLTFLAATYYFEAAALPDALARAWSRGFAAAGARALDAVGLDGTRAPESAEDAP